MVDALSPMGIVENLNYAASPLPAVGLYMWAAVCPSGEIDDDSKFSSPMPFVGLYIAAATLVCFLCMVSDLWSGLSSGKPWLPCKWFPLNSITLTLLSVATKLSVDLTTTMPGKLDQLCKLTSSVFLCIAMGFFMPSVASSTPTDCLANLIALSILVGTVISNVIIQVNTGAIFTFFVEHVVVLVSMLLLLALLWSTSLQVHYQTYGYAYSHRYFAKQIPARPRLPNMETQLKNLFPYSSTWNPQFLCCVSSNCSSVGLICGVAVAVLLEAIFKKEMEFCKGVSDYRWSMRCVFFTHLTTIMLGAYVVCHRWLIIVCHRNIELQNWRTLFKNETLVALFSTLPKELHILFHRPRILALIIKLPLSILNVVIVSASAGVVILCLMVRKICLIMVRKIFTLWMYTIGSTNTRKPITYPEVVCILNKSIHEDVVLKKWIYTIAKKNMEKLMEKSELGARTPLIKLLSKHFPPTSQPAKKSLLSDMQAYYVGRTEEYEFEAISSQSMVTLVKIASHSMSNSHISNCLTAALELSNFIEHKMSPECLENKLDELRERRVRFFKLCMEKPKVGKRDDNPNPSISLIGKLKEGALNMDGYTYIICDCILDRSYATMNELSDHIERAFVEILCCYLVDLPTAIFREYNEGPIETCEARTSRAFKFMYVLKLLENINVPMKWPDYAAIHKRDRLTVALPIAETYHEVTIDHPPLSEAIQQTQYEQYCRN